jgi:signal transduction histidine kinase
MRTARTGGWRRLEAFGRGPGGSASLLALAIFLLLLPVWWLAAQWYSGRLIAERQATAQVSASLRANALSAAINRRFALLRGLYAFVHTESSAGDFGVKFQVFAGRLYANAEGIRDISVAPSGVVRYIYPLTGNELELGYEVMNDPRSEVRVEVQRAIESGRMVLGGPHELIQGGQGLVARQAVYQPEDTFWGLVSVTMDVQSILKEAGLVEADPLQADLVYALRDGDGNVLFDPHGALERDPVLYQVSLPEGAWEVAAAPHGGWQADVQSSATTFLLIGLLIVFLLTGLVFLAALNAGRARELAALNRQAGQLAALQERQRLARELHDSVSQALYGIGLGARTARAVLERSPEKGGEAMDYVLSLAEAGLTEMRALIFELRPESLASEGLVTALGKQAAALRARHQIQVQTVFGDEPAVPLEAKEALYRVAQEALNNAARHAHARQVELRLESADGSVRLLVLDDGQGFDPKKDYPGHLGLRSMRERVERLGGRLTIESAPGSGARVEAIVPLPMRQ